MESEPTRDGPRKHKFKPKAPPRREPKPEVKAEKEEQDVDSVQAMNLMRQFQERSSIRAKAKVEKKVKASQIAFGFGAASTSLKSYGVPTGRSTNSRDQNPAVNGGAFPSNLREKEYVEPWDYYSYYPVTLPMRRPYSGNPAILDEEEFREASETFAYDENATNHAENLSLMEENVEPSIFMLQLPPTMPMIKRSATGDVHQTQEISRPRGGEASGEKACGLGDLTAGFMGKMLVYRSGAVKLKLGDTLYDVSPGMDCAFAQDVVAINTAEKHCCVVAEVDKRATVTPDVDAILSSMSDL